MAETSGDRCEEWINVCLSLEVGDLILPYDKLAKSRESLQTEDSRGARSRLAFIATIIVLRDINTAPMAGVRRMPTG